MINTTYKDIKDHLINDLNLRSTDIVFLFSGIWGLGKIENNNLNIILDAFDSVLKKGLLIIPTFSYSWNNNKTWEINSVNCIEMGSLSCHTINLENFRRTNHPNFSVNIMNNKFNTSMIDHFLDIDNNTFGKKSIFGKVYDISKKIRSFVLLFGGAFDDVLYRSTFIHYAQQTVGVHHRFLKKIYDPLNNDFVLQYSRYLESSEVRNKKILNYFNLPVEEDFSNYGKDLLSNNKLVVKKFKFYPSRMVKVSDSVDFMINKLKKNKFYCINENSIKK